MNRALFPACLLLFCIGCEGSPFVPESLPAPRAAQKVIVNGLDAGSDAYVDDQGLRVGWYFNFAPYDSLNITFTAERYTAGQETVPFSIKIGPAYRVRGFMTGQKQDFSFFVTVRDLAKPQSAALVFFVPDSVSPLVLSNLRVIGWYTY